ncbi:hypothetical protein IMCC3135_33615 [Granulosicoccus antarcticus IMCC3135]|uniref:Uncharacterized protein n=1 Tax=Granulosicoccus antarcticus IMCC3135 TaxID=1192854 RepID=A0A2Z2PA52_9GAMM|nr:hypothetical protein IMCC3135_33615 [Granulosicoccus antarcticus IMCC3135]
MDDRARLCRRDRLSRVGQCRANDYVLCARATYVDKAQAPQPPFPLGEQQVNQRVRRLEQAYGAGE